MAKNCYCFLEKFNNYFNRKLIRHEALADYESAAADHFVPVDGEGAALPFDFNPNDNITTEIIVNKVPFDPDYFLLLDENGAIESRWFVLEQVRNRQGQWVYSLRRDVLADSYEKVKEAPAYVEKGVIGDLNDPLLLNSEGVMVNQIKKEEILLKDKTGVPWLVMYLKKGTLKNASVGSGGKISVNVPNDDSFVYATLATPIASWIYYQYTTSDFKVSENDELKTYCANSMPAWLFPNSYYVINDVTGETSYGSLSGSTDTNLVANVLEKHSAFDAAYDAQAGGLRSLFLSAFGYEDNVSALMAFNGKIIKDSQGKYFKVRVYVASSGETTHKITTASAPALKNSMNNLFNTAVGESQSANDEAFVAVTSWTSYRVSLEELTDVETTVDFAAYTGEGTKDSMLFDVIAMPYGRIHLLSLDLSINLYTSADRSMTVMNSLAIELTSNYVLDLQLLPYCPVPEINMAAIPADRDKYALLGKRSDGFLEVLEDVVFVARSANFTVDIAQTVEITDSSDVPDTFKKKYVNDCTMVRLCSPNYSGLFEMNLAKNGGRITSFNVDVTLRPFNPYIHVNPDFSYLYGQDFNDVRGLICGGDFSLGIINDAWNSYEIQNKNYQAIFDRQIQNLDVNQAINMEEARWRAAAGTLSGGASAGAAGLFATGNPIGGAIGAGVGGLLSGLAGMKDISNLEKRQREERSFAIDSFNLSLGNVRALPNSITKTSALTYNNKLFPFVEVYACSEEEKEAYYLKLKYGGMTVSKIGKMASFASADNSNFFKARMIRLETLGEDNHFLEAINEELMKGVYI